LIGLHDSMRSLRILQSSARAMKSVSPALGVSVEDATGSR
jgi:hypothetical protein